MENKFISSDEFLKTYDWRKLRQTILNKYGNKCMCCGATPSDDIYMCVDHIRPRKTNPELALDENNLQVLCNVCNHGKGNWNTKDWRPSAEFVITEAWLRQHTKGGAGISKLKAKAVGMSFPLKSGWFKKLLGLQITHKQRIEFENAQTLNEVVAKAKVDRERNNEADLSMSHSDREVQRLKKQLHKLSSLVGQLNRCVKK